jgi:uncharacterized protein YndB with AHSA1/START domain
MKILKYIGIGLGGLIILLLIVPVVLPTTSTMNRSMVINASPDSVYNYISNFNNFSQWSPFLEKEPTAKVTVEGTGVGSKYSWAGEEIGKGSMTIIGLDPNKLVDIKLEFIEPFQTVSSTKWTIEPVEGGSKLIWKYSEENIPYFKRYFGICMDGILGGLFEKGLSNLNNKIGKK